MAKTKEEFEALNNKLKELTEEELKLVTGGSTAAQVEQCVQDMLEPIQEQYNQKQQNLGPNIEHRERIMYTGGGMKPCQCKVCKEYYPNWDTALEHVKNAHNGDSNMIEIIEFM